MTAAYDSLISEDLLNDLAAHTEALNDAAIERLDIDDFKGMALALEAEEACDQPGLTHGGHSFALEPDEEAQLDSAVKAALEAVLL